MPTTIIVKNNMGSPVFIEDMGLEIPGSGQRIISDIFDFSEICISENLKTYVGDATFTINNGTNDLPISEGLDYIKCKLEIGVITPHSILDHMDVDSTLPLDDFRLTYDSISGLWSSKSGNIDVQSDVPPDSTSTIWIDPEKPEPYFFDPNLSDWMAIDRTVFSFGRAGRVDGSYLQSSGVTRSGYYYIHRPAKITHVYYRAQNGKSDKGIEIHVNGSSIYNFNLVNLLYVSELNIDLEIGDELRVRVSNQGAYIEDSVCQIEVGWRYVP